MSKIKIHEISKQFGVPNKEILEVLAKYNVTGKSYMSSLEGNEVDILLEYYTQKNDKGEDLRAFLRRQFEAKEEPNVKTEKKENNETVKETASEEVSEKFTRKKEVRYIDTRTNAVDLEQQLNREKAQDLVNVDMKDTETNKQKIKKNKNKPSQGKKNQPNEEIMEKKKPEKKQEKLHILIPDEITVGDLAKSLKCSPVEIIKRLMQLGIMATVNQSIGFDEASMIAEDMGAEVEKEVVVTLEEKLFNDTPDEEADLQPRPPVVVVMGHVDHGKTSLLDCIRKANVTATEAGGITQHIGAYTVNVSGKSITFLDTPGHEAFTAMRLRGAMVTDIAIIVVAADDGIMPQTIEAINHAKAAEVSIIVAINKIDREGANPDRVRQELTEYGIVPEEWGGDTVCVEVSAKQNIGIDNLLEMLTLTAELKELKANPNRQAKGTVVESKLDKGRGPVATVLVQNGTLKAGDIIVAGTAVGRVRAMTDHNGKKIKEAGPSTPVEIIGLSETPDGGDTFYVVDDEKAARSVVESRKQKIKDEAFKAQSKVSLDNLFDVLSEGAMKTLNIIVKADVQGSVEAVKQSLEKIANEEVKVKVIHGAVGGITESDVTLAAASNAIIVGFNVRPDAGARSAAETSKVDVRTYRIIYEAIEEIEAALRGMLAPKFREAVIGHAEIRDTFKVSGVGTIAGSYVTDGKIVRHCSVRIVRDGIVIHEGELSSLKRFKDDAKEVAAGYECGMAFTNYNDIKVGDSVECYVMEEVKQD
ncbi:MAG: translation initiation factor IF-2 [Clostridia bacterium]